MLLHFYVLCRALKFNRQKIPAQRVAELEKVLYDFYGIPDISDDVINAAADLDIKQVLFRGTLFYLLNLPSGIYSPSISVLLGFFFFFFFFKY
jgi:hypothetical protein